MAIRVVVADDSLIVREGIQQILANSPSVDVVAACGDFDAVIAAVDEFAPDVVITDIRMPPSWTNEGIRLATELRERHPEIGVMVLSLYVDPGYAIDLLDLGTDGRGYLLKERVHNRGELVSAIHSIAAGGSVIDPKIVEALVDERTRSERSLLSELTEREREVLAQIATGQSNAAIAGTLVLTKRAVEKHINSIFLKLGLTGADDVSKRVKAALICLAEG